MAKLDLGKVVPEKGVDYYTEEEKTELKNEIETEIKIPTKTSDLTNDSGFIDNTVNNLTNYTLGIDTGHTIDLSINSSTYVMTLDLKNSAGTTISTDTVDLPLESVVVSGTYDSTNKKIVLTLQSGSTIDIPVGDLVSGLQEEITSNNKLSSDLVDDNNNTNKFVTTSEKTTWNNKYEKPSGGIPNTDLSSAVQTSLGKADTALQTETYTGTITSIKMNGNTVASSGEADLGTVITQHQDISGKQDVMQYSTVPTASSETVGKIIQYTGTTDSNYTNGYFYKGISTTEGNETTYSWVALNVQTTPDVSGKEDTSNKVTSLSSSSTDIQYPSAKCVYNALAGAGGSNANIQYLGTTNQYTYSQPLDLTGFKKGIYIINIDNNSFQYGSSIPIKIEYNGSYRTGDLSYSQDRLKPYLFIEIPKNMPKNITSTKTVGYSYQYDRYWGLRKESINLTTSTIQVPLENIAYYPLYADKNRDITAQYTFNTKIPTTTITPSEDNHFSTKKYIDDLIAPAYDSTQTYDVGDLVIYSSSLYQCNTAVTTAEAWDSSKWTETTLAEVLKGV